VPSCVLCLGYKKVTSFVYGSQLRYVVFQDCRFKDCICFCMARMSTIVVGRF
jgi:hypothetical protein